MTKQNIIIIGHQVLYDILDEFKSYLSFEITNFINENEYYTGSMINKENIKNSLYIFKTVNINFLKKFSIDKNQIFTIPNKPVKIFMLIEQINIKLLKQKYLNQSNISFGNYKLDVNTRVISKNNVKLKLTEKEIDTIIFLGNQTTPQNTKDLLRKVWGYIADIDTHTVETHIYRLRKKINEKFNDEKFIISQEKGYQILREKISS
jgi:DNA-binding winged helix-turn-helix (wHTH) protein|tara:strand:+ start:1420 stop:2037 length:618 start_codon:yes stop_codon:yes gene_type:complete